MMFQTVAFQLVATQMIAADDYALSPSILSPASLLRIASSHRFGLIHCASHDWSDLTEVLALFLWRRLWRRLRHSLISTHKGHLTKSLQFMMAFLEFLTFMGFRGTFHWTLCSNIWDPYSLSLKAAHAHLLHDDSCKFNSWVGVNPGLTNLFSLGATVLIAIHHFLGSKLSQVQSWNHFPTGQVINREIHLPYLQV